MSKGAKAVTRWRRRAKARAVVAMGGVCIICSYNRCLKALTFHHLDESEKDFAISGKGNHSWKRIVAELRKCVLLCTNCHAEVHAKIAKIPDDPQCFNERYSDYQSCQAGVDQCPVCFTPKSEDRKYCSRACAATGKGKIDWEQYDGHITELRAHGVSYERIGDTIGVSGGAVWKRLRKL